MHTTDKMLRASRKMKIGRGAVIPVMRSKRNALAKLYCAFALKVPSAQRPLTGA